MLFDHLFTHHSMIFPRIHSFVSFLNIRSAYSYALSIWSMASMNLKGFLFIRNGNLYLDNTKHGIVFLSFLSSIKTKRFLSSDFLIWNRKKQTLFSIKWIDLHRILSESFRDISDQNHGTFAELYRILFSIRYFFLQNETKRIIVEFGVRRQQIHLTDRLMSTSKLLQRIGDGFDIQLQQNSPYIVQMYDETSREYLPLQNDQRIFDISRDFQPLHRFRIVNKSTQSQVEGIQFGWKTTFHIETSSLG